MPKGKKEYNPYRLVTKATNPPREYADLQKLTTHERFQGHSGLLQAQLLTLTPLVLGGRRDPYKDDYLSPKEIEKGCMHRPEDDRPLIPGSSLKGVISTLYEIVAGAQASRMIFGNISSNAKGRNFKGHIYFSDAVLDTSRSPSKAHKAANLPAVDTILSDPKTRHSAFYGEKQNQRKVKLYHHQPQVQSIWDLRREAPTRHDRRPMHGSSPMQTIIFPLPTSCCFDFSVSFQNLTDFQLALLLRLVCLPKGLCHKIGGAKPLGAGSVHIRPVRMELYTDRVAYYGGRGQSQSANNTDDCLAMIKELCAAITLPDELQRMLLWRPRDRRKYQYPSHKWFKDNSHVLLRSVSEVYPQPCDSASMHQAQEDLEKRWQKLEQMAQQESQQRQQRQARDAQRAQEKARFAALSPLEQALELWKEQDCSPKCIFHPEEVTSKVAGEVEQAPLQRAMLLFLKEQQKPKLQKWRKKYEKAESKARRTNKPMKNEGSWGKLCKLANELGITDFRDGI